MTVAGVRGAIVDRNGIILAETAVEPGTAADSPEVSRRHYPNGTLAAHVVGFVDEAGEGQSGIEKSMDALLHGSIDDSERALHGATVMLTLDSRIQKFTERAVEKMCLDFNAKAGWAVVQKVRTGEILAMVSIPTCDPGRAGEAPLEAMRNKAISLHYEPGSVMKAALISSALNDSVVDEDDLIDCENGSWEYAGRPVRDSHALETITVADVIKYSSNIGAAKIALMMGREKLYESFKEFHFGKRLGIELPGEESGILYSPDHWSDAGITRIAMGHEITVTALQLVSMMSAIAHDGIQMRPAVVKDVTAADGIAMKIFQPEVISRPLSPDTARRAQQVLILPTEDAGTAMKARVAGYQVAGKTATAQKVRPENEGGGYYPDRFIATFAGFLPTDDPEIAIIVVADDPGVLNEAGRKTQYFGGAVCAPVFSDIAGFAMDILNADIAAQADELLSVYTNQQPFAELQDGWSRAIYPVDVNGNRIRVIMTNGTTDEIFTFGPYENPTELVIDYSDDVWYKLIIEEHDDPSDTWTAIFSTWIMSGSGD